MEVNAYPKEVVKAIKEGTTNKVECVTLIKEIKRIMAHHEEVIMDKVFKEENVCADALAKEGCDKKFSRIYNEAPFFVKSMLDMDIVGFIPSLEGFS